MHYVNELTVCVCKVLLKRTVNACCYPPQRISKILPKSTLLWDSQRHARSSCLVGGCYPPGWRRKGLSPVSASQQLLQLTFGPWSKGPALSGVNIKWWTFSSRAALYFCCQTDSRHISAGSDWYSDTCRNDYEAAGCCWTVKRRLATNIFHNSRKTIPVILPVLAQHVIHYMYVCFPHARPGFFQVLQFFP